MASAAVSPATYIYADDDAINTATNNSNTPVASKFTNQLWWNEDFEQTTGVRIGLRWCTRALGGHQAQLFACAVIGCVPVLLLGQDGVAPSVKFAVAMFAAVANCAFILVLLNSPFSLARRTLRSFDFLLKISSVGIYVATQIWTGAWIQASLDDVRFWLGTCMRSVALIPNMTLLFTLDITKLWKQHPKLVFACCWASLLYWFYVFLELVLTLPGSPAAKCVELTSGKTLCSSSLRLSALFSILIYTFKALLGAIRQKGLGPSAIAFNPVWKHSKVASQYSDICQCEHSLAAPNAFAVTFPLLVAPIFITALLFTQQDKFAVSVLTTVVCFASLLSLRHCDWSLVRRIAFSVDGVYVGVHATLVATAFGLLLLRPCGLVAAVVCAVAIWTFLAVLLLHDAWSSLTVITKQARHHQPGSRTHNFVKCLLLVWNMFFFLAIAITSLFAVSSIQDPDECVELNANWRLCTSDALQSFGVVSMFCLRRAMSILTKPQSPTSVTVPFLWSDIPVKKPPATKQSRFGGLPLPFL